MMVFAESVSFVIMCARCHSQVNMRRVKHRLESLKNSDG